MIVDSLGRQLRYLRISVTDRCNLRCIYCTPEQGIALSPSGEILTYEEIEWVARVAVSLGLQHIRLTGGEPLVRKDFCSLVQRLSRIPGLTDLSLTTNGILLPALAQSLKGAGLGRVNISLDTLEKERFRRLTRGGEISQPLAGIQAALEAGLSPVKINMVLFADAAGEPPEAEVIDFAEMSRRLPVHVRFIEWMPLAERLNVNGLRPVPAEWAWRTLRRVGELQSYAGPGGSGPARYFRYTGAAGSLGFISPLSAPFCVECSRLRLTSTGGLKLCLFHEQEIDLRGPLRAGASEEELAALFQEAARVKPASYSTGKSRLAGMCQIGG